MKRKEKNKTISKYSLLKVLSITFLIFVVLTWIIPSGAYNGSTYEAYTDGRLPLGLFDLFIYPFYSFGIFAQYFLVFLAIGGFYGVLNKTGVYSKIVNGISKKLEKKKTLFLILTIVLFSLLSAVVGNQITLFLLVPLFIAVLLKLGYCKVTSLAATIGSILVGVMGSIFGNNVYYVNFLGIGAYDGIWTKVIFYVIITVLYILFILYQNGLFKKNKKEVQSDEVKTLEIPLYDNIEAKKSTVPLIIILVLLVLISFAGVINWNYTFNTQIFTDFDAKIVAIPWLSKILGGVVELGRFGNYELAAVIFIATFLVKWVYSIKFDEFADAFKDGAKQMIKPAIYVVLACIIFASMVNSAYQYNISATISNYLFSLSNDINVLIATLTGYFGGFFFNDYAYALNSVYGVLQSFNVSAYTAISILFQSGYGLAMLSLPVSVSLIAGLKYLNVSYKDWMKYIYKFLLLAFIVVIIFGLIIL